MDPDETRRRLAIADASDKLWNGTITRSRLSAGLRERGDRICRIRSFEASTSDSGDPYETTDQGNGRPELCDRAIERSAEISS